MKREVSGSSFVESCTLRWKITWIQVGHGKGECQGPSPDRGVLISLYFRGKPGVCKSGKREGRSGRAHLARPQVRGEHKVGGRGEL